MGAAQGFVSTAPDALYGDTTLGVLANYAVAQKFTAGGAGAQELTELGVYAVGVPATIKMAVFTHDAVNDCPAALVANSERDLTFSSGSYAKQAAAYTGTKPQVTGGDVYWIAILTNTAVLLSAFAAAGELERGATYPTWPTDTEWHTHGDYNYDLSVYAVYQAAGAAAGTVPVTRLRTQQMGLMP